MIPSRCLKNTKVGDQIIWQKLYFEELNIAPLYDTVIYHDKEGWPVVDIAGHKVSVRPDSLMSYIGIRKLPPMKTIEQLDEELIQQLVRIDTDVKAEIKAIDQQTIAYLMAAHFLISVAVILGLVIFALFFRQHGNVAGILCLVAIGNMLFRGVIELVKWRMNK